MNPFCHRLFAIQFARRLFVSSTQDGWFSCIRYTLWIDTAIHLTDKWNLIVRHFVLYINVNSYALILMCFFCFIHSFHPLNINTENSLQFYHRIYSILKSIKDYILIELHVEWLAPGFMWHCIWWGPMRNLQHSTNYWTIESYFIERLTMRTE